MKKRVVIVCLLMFFLLSTFAYAEDYVDVIIKPKKAYEKLQLKNANSITSTAVEKFTIDNKNIISKHEFNNLNFISAKITKDYYEKLMNDPNLEIYPDGILKLHMDISGPQVSSPIVNGIVVNGKNITGDGQVICVVDSGVDSSHPYLASSIVAQSCACSISNYGKGGCCYPNGTITSANATDDYFHGTHAIGIMTSDSPVYKGIAPGVKIIAFRAFDKYGNAKESDVLAGFDYCLDFINQYNLSVVSMSFGGGVYSTYCDSSDWFAKATMEIFNNTNITLVASSGNKGCGSSGCINKISSPACGSKIISVGAVDDADNIQSWSNSAYFLDILAPGSNICSTYSRYSAFSQGNVGCGNPANVLFTESSGTSWSAPIVAAGVALIQQYSMETNHKYLTPLEVENLMKRTGKYILDTRNSYHFPRLNLSSAIYSIIVPENLFCNDSRDNDNDTHIDCTDLDCYYDFCKGNDYDNDTYNKTIDCNDTNYYVNPGKAEIYYNRIDDDCNSTTKDDPFSPIINITFPLNNTLLNTTIVTIRYLVVENSSFNCSLNIDSSINLVSDSRDFNVTLILQEGVHFFIINCTDYYNNTNTSLKSFFTIDTTPPNIYLNISGTDPMSPLHSNSISYYFISNDTSLLDNITQYLDNKETIIARNLRQKIYSNNLQLTWQLPGKHTLEIVSTDILGHTSKKTSTFYSTGVLNPSLFYQNNIKGVIKNLEVFIGNINVTNSTNESLSNNYSITIRTENGTTINISNFYGGVVGWNYGFDITENDVALPTMIRSVTLKKFENFLNPEQYTPSVVFDITNIAYNKVLYCDDELTNCQILHQSSPTKPTYEVKNNFLTVHPKSFSSVILSLDSFVSVNIQSPLPDSILPSGENIYLNYTINETANSTFKLDAQPAKQSTKKSSSPTLTFFSDILTENSLPVLKNGKHTILLEYTDGINIGIKQFNFTVNDITPPSITITSPQAKLYYTNKSNFYRINISVSLNEIANVNYTINKITNSGTVLVKQEQFFQNKKADRTIEQLPTGNYTIQFRFQDIHKNTNTAIVNFKINATLICVDKDDDGFYAELEGCQEPFDCDDNNDEINPDINERGSSICNDNKDNDCDGDVDREDLGCYTSGGGGGGGGTGESANNQQQTTQPQGYFFKTNEPIEEEKLWSSVAAGEEAFFDINSGAIPLYSVSFKLNQFISRPRMKIKRIDFLPEGISRPDLPLIYSYFSINTVGLDEKLLSEAIVTIKIDSAWIKENNIDIYSVKILRYNDGWKAFSTNFDGTKKSYYLFSASIPGFSYFAIGAEKKKTYEDIIELPPSKDDVLPELNIEQNKTEEDTPVEIPLKTAKDKFSWILVIAVIVIAIAVFLIVRKKYNEEPPVERIKKKGFLEQQSLKDFLDKEIEDIKH